MHTLAGIGVRMRMGKRGAVWTHRGIWARIITSGYAGGAPPALISTKYDEWRPLTADTLMNVLATR